MSILSRRETLLALSTLALGLIACDADERIAGGDALAAPKQVSAQALRNAVSDPRTKAFYEQRAWRAAWTPSTSAQLQSALKDLPRHGIDPVRLAGIIKSQDPAAREVELTQAALSYGDALAHGLAKPQTLFAIFALERNDLNVDKTLATALADDTLSDWIEALPPGDEDYQTLSKAYLTYQERAAGPQPAALPKGRPVKPGRRDGRMPQIAQMLEAAGYPAPLDATDPSRYGPPIVEAVKAFQNDQGINADGVLGADTVAVMNAGPSDHARQIALNLEARRWLKRQVPDTRIDVNTACTFLTYFRGGKAVDSRRVVAGKPKHETPHLSGAFKQLVVNPPWNVPEGIAAAEILPKGQAYLAANDMYVADGRVIQRPGPKSSLGLVKFDMQNRYAIYLHDTPSKARFNANERHFSHGCVRVAEAVEFARMLANEHGKGAEFEEKLAAGKTAVVDLGVEVPVRLLYHTVFVDPKGRVGFRPDVYGWDAMLATALGMDAPMRRDPLGAIPDVSGP